MFGNFSLFKTPFPGWNSVPPSFVSFLFCLLYFFLPLFEELGCFSGCLMSSAGIQKLFCGIYSMFKCSFDEFVGEKVFPPSYSSAILAPPPNRRILKKLFVYLWLRWVFADECRLFSDCSEQGLLSSCGAQASHCSGFCCCRAQALWHTGFSSCSTWVQLLWLPSCIPQAR